jgi:hypothetical protein
MSDATTAKLPHSEAVGRFRLSVARGVSTPVSEELWNHRADALARWLVAEWYREQGERKTA